MFRAGEDSGVGAPVDCPCVGVRDSRYDNSCARDCPRGASSPPIKRRVIAPPTSPRRADAVIEALYEYSFFLYCTVAFCSEIFFFLFSRRRGASRRHFLARPPRRVVTVA